jgi:hypothetical protein
VLPALIPAAAVTAWAAGHVGRARWLVELACLAAVVDGIGYTYDLPTRRVVLAALVLAAAAALAFGAVLAWRRIGPSRARLAFAIGGAAVAVVGIVALGQATQERFNDKRYRGYDATVDWLLANAPSGRTVGLTGNWSTGGLVPVWPAFGPRLRNHVEFVGPVHKGQLGFYTEREPFLEAVDDGGYDLLEVGRGFTPGTDPREAKWARSAGWAEVAQSDRFTLLARPDTAISDDSP